MSGNLTVIGGRGGSTGLTGLVTVASGFTGPVLAGLQSLLSSASGAASMGAANFDKLDVAGQSGSLTPTVGGFPTGVLVLANSDGNNSSTAGAANVSVTVPAGYDTLVVQAPGRATVQGNGASFFAVFGSQSAVDFDAAGGNGQVYASGNDTVNLSGVDDFTGGSQGYNLVNATGLVEAVTLAGAGNSVVSSAGTATILSAGSSDAITTAGSSSDADVVVSGNAVIHNIGSADTINATGSGTFLGFFSGSAGGEVDFVNTSSAASSIIASLNPISGAVSSQGSVTVSAGAGGGIYDGGISGNNSLIGGSGAVTLFSAGVNNYLYADGNVAGAGYNLLNAYSGGNDTLVAGSNTSNNVFFAGIGTESIASYGSGSQSFFVGTEGSETISGSAVSGASNSFIFQQAASQGGGTDVLINFKPGEGYINLGNGINNVAIISYEGLSGAHGGTQIDLSNGTTIKLLGIGLSSFGFGIIGGTHF